MDENAKRIFDAWATLLNQAWQEYQDKVRAEWRLSFGIWGALLATIGTVVGDSGMSRIEQHITCPTYVAATLGIVIIIGQFCFLYWIQKRLHDARHAMWECQRQMRPMLSAKEPKEPELRPLEHLTLWIQFGITVVLSLLLWALV